MAARAPCARPEARLYFLARDMYLMRDVYHTLYPQEETGYLQVSRRSLAPRFWRRGTGPQCWPPCRGRL